VEIEISDDGRTVTFAFVVGEDRIERSFNIPSIQYKDIWKEGFYEINDVVTYDGSMWICRKPTKNKPGQYTKDWRLCVKRGRNGKST
jgi:hypothetical protein